MYYYLIIYFYSSNPIYLLILYQITEIIPKLIQKNEQINSELEKKLIYEIEKNKKLENEIKILKEKYNKNEQLKNNEIKKLKDEIDIYKKNYDKCNKEKENIIKENKKLNEELVKANKVLGGIQNNNINNNEIKKLKDEIEYMKYQLGIKDNEINELKRKIKNEEPKFNFDDVMWIYFQPIDNSFKEGIKCLKTNTFAEVEEKLYKKYNTLRNTNNNFTANATPVLRFKTIEENKIKDQDIIILYKIE